MLHYVARSLAGTLLIHDWREGSVLFRALLERAPGADLVVMPDHIHLLTDRPIDLADAMSSFARWRNHARGARGPVWDAAPPPSEPADEQKRRRTVRYVYLNPCRAKLVSDPLAWPLSTYRDAVGLASPALRARASDPVRLHARVADDDTVAPDSLLPFGNGAALVGEAGLRAVEAAVSEVTRRSFSALRVRGRAKTLLAVAARRLVDVPAERVAEFVHLAPRSLRDLNHARLPELAIVARVLLDDRFPGLTDGDLHHHPAWARYAAVRRGRPPTRA